MASSTMSKADRIDRVKSLITSIEGFPKPGITFRDIFPVMRDPVVFADCMALLTEHVQELKQPIDAVIGLDARGFIFGIMLAQQLGVSFVPIRKAGKLPGETIQVSYTLEYGSATFELHKNALQAGQKIIIIDDLLATGGTMAAACQLVKQLKCDIVECVVAIELTDLKGRDKLTEKLFTLTTYSGE
ncbi:Adenine phosphoribosyltransferase [Lamellibrachia satsuma]|nr:Adenine phosphoribosyltransferase [Lamellibrachia satsuma]